MTLFLCEINLDPPSFLMGNRKTKKKKTLIFSHIHPVIPEKYPAYAKPKSAN